MKRSIKLALAAAVALSGTAAFATNGDHLIGTGAKARGMGGVGIGMSHGAESALVNPALITSVKGTEVSFGGTVFMPDVKTDTEAGVDYKKSKNDLSVIPEVSIAQKTSENFAWGIGMFGTAGMGVDHRAATGAINNYHMVTNLQLMQFAVPLAYSTSGFSVGVAPVLQWGSLDIKLNNSTTQGVAQDFGLGYNAGVAYEIADVTVGASYKSAINMSYAGQISQASKQFGMNGGAGFSDNLEQPAEMGLGVSYVLGSSTFAADFKQINWANAKGYKDFGWVNQKVYALGYQFAQDGWALRAGYNHAASPINEQWGTDANAKNMFNLLGFPGIVETHYTVGGSFDISKSTSVDLAYVHVPEKVSTFTATGMTGDNTISTKHSQKSVAAQLNFKF